MIYGMFRLSRGAWCHMCVSSLCATRACPTLRNSDTENKSSIGLVLGSVPVMRTYPMSESECLRIIRRHTHTHLQLGVVNGFYQSRSMFGSTRRETDKGLSRVRIKLPSPPLPFPHLFASEGNHGIEVHWTHRTSSVLAPPEVQSILDVRSCQGRLCALCE